MSKCTALYIRVSTDKQANGLEAQERALVTYCQANGIGSPIVFSDEAISGAKASRPGLNALMDAVRTGTVSNVIVYSFSRFARSTTHLLEALRIFQEHDVAFTSLSEKLDTSSPTGRAVFTIIAAISQLERELIAERVRNGLANARAKGKRLGRPTTVDREIVRAFVKQGMRYREIARLTGASHGTIRQVVKEMSCSKGSPSEQSSLVD